MIPQLAAKLIYLLADRFGPLVRRPFAWRVGRSLCGPSLESISDPIATDPSNLHDGNSLRRQTGRISWECLSAGTQRILSQTALPESCWLSG